jgi:hypothetical protein
LVIQAISSNFCNLQCMHLYVMQWAQLHGMLCVEVFQHARTRRQTTLIFAGLTAKCMATISVTATASTWVNVAAQLEYQRNDGN